MCSPGQLYHYPVGGRHSVGPLPDVDQLSEGTGCTAAGGGTQTVSADAFEARNIQLHVQYPHAVNRSHLEYLVPDGFQQIIAQARCFGEILSEHPFLRSVQGQPVAADESLCGNPCLRRVFVGGQVFGKLCFIQSEIQITT